MALTREQTFIRAVETMCWGATGYTRYNDEYTLVYGVRFANGHRIEDPDMHKTARQADAYAKSVYALTGEYP